MSLPRSPLALLAIASLLPACAAQIGDPDALGGSGGTLTFEEFLDTVEREPFEGGVWIVDGDVPIESEKRLVDYYESLVADGALTVARYGGRDQIWDATERRALTYCVSTSFAGRYDRVVAAMAEAAAAWEAVADVDFRHASAEDGRCTASNASVLFDVRPVTNAGYLARAFFPYQSRGSRNVLIDDTSFYVRSPLTLAGVLRHELGHVLGFRHEHTRPEAGRCYEDGSWRGVTEYDRASVMHYPQCGGTNSALTLSDADAAGAASLYGAPSGEAPAPPAPSGTPRAGSTEASVSAGQEVRYAPMAAAGGTVFRVSMTGTNDADLYVRFGAAPTTSAYDCRPYRADSNETCELTVPDGGAEAHVMVRGYTEASYRIEVSWTAP